MDEELPGQAQPRPEARPRPRRPLRSTQEGRERRRRIAFYALFGAAFVLTVNAVLGERGYVATVRAEREYAALAASLAAQRRENERILTEIRRLRHEPAALEEAARRLGLIRPGETMIVVRDARPAPDPATK